MLPEIADKTVAQVPKAAALHQPDAPPPLATPIMNGHKSSTSERHQMLVKDNRERRGKQGGPQCKGHSPASPASPKLAPLARVKRLPPKSLQETGRPLAQTAKAPEHQDEMLLPWDGLDGKDEARGGVVRQVLQVQQALPHHTIPDNTSDDSWASAEQEAVYHIPMSALSPDSQADVWSIPSETSPIPCMLTPPLDTVSSLPGVRLAGGELADVARRHHEMHQDKVQQDMIKSSGISSTAGTQATQSTTGRDDIGRDDTAMTLWRQQLQEEVGHGAALALMQQHHSNHPAAPLHGLDGGHEMQGSEMQGSGIRCMAEWMHHAIQHQVASESIQQTALFAPKTPPHQHLYARDKVVSSMSMSSSTNAHGKEAVRRSKADINFSDLILMVPPIGTGSNKTVYKATWKKHVVVSASMAPS